MADPVVSTGTTKADLDKAKVGGDKKTVESARQERGIGITYATHYLGGQAAGVRVLSIKSGSPAESTGLREGDIILKVNNGTTNNALEFIDAEQRSGAKMSVEFLSTSRVDPRGDGTNVIVSLKTQKADIPLKPLYSSKESKDRTEGAYAVTRVGVPWPKKEADGVIPDRGGELGGPGSAPVEVPVEMRTSTVLGQLSGWGDAGKNKVKDLDWKVYDSKTKETIPYKSDRGTALTIDKGSALLKTLLYDQKNKQTEVHDGSVLVGLGVPGKDNFFLRTDISFAPGHPGFEAANRRFAAFLGAFLDKKDRKQLPVLIAKRAGGLKGALGWKYTTETLYLSKEDLKQFLQPKK